MARCDTGCRAGCLAAVRAERRIMVNHRIGRLHLPRRLALVASLAAGLLARFLRYDLPVRAGLFKPSLDGGLPLFELCRPSWRSSSATRAVSAAICPCCFSTIDSRVSIRLRLRWLIRLLHRKLKSHQDAPPQIEITYPLKNPAAVPFLTLPPGELPLFLSCRPISRPLLTCPPWAAPPTNWAVFWPANSTCIQSGADWAFQGWICGFFWPATARRRGGGVWHSF